MRSWLFMHVQILAYFVCFFFRHLQLTACWEKVSSTCGKHREWRVDYPVIRLYVNRNTFTTKCLVMKRISLRCSIIFSVLQLETWHERYTIMTMDSQEDVFNGTCKKSVSKNRLYTLRNETLTWNIQTCSSGCNVLTFYVRICFCKCLYIPTWESIIGKHIHYGHSMPYYT